jgi:hypothetical protein
MQSVELTGFPCAERDLAVTLASMSSCGRGCARAASIAGKRSVPGERERPTVT